MSSSSQARKRAIEETQIHYIPQAAVRSRAQHVFVDRFRGNKRQVVREKVDFFLHPESRLHHEPAVPAAVHESFTMPPPLDYEGLASLNEDPMSEDPTALGHEDSTPTNARLFRTAVCIFRHVAEPH